MPNKPTRFGFKLWVLAESHSGYTWNFDVYTGRTVNDQPEVGLAYNVVMRLTQPLLNQGYSLYCDNFYSTIGLAQALKECQTYFCGTITSIRLPPPPPPPPQLRSSKTWGNDVGRGPMRYVRQSDCVYSMATPQTSYSPHQQSLRPPMNMCARDEFRISSLDTSS